MEPRNIKMLLHDDLMCQILLWLPVISLLRFKLACRTWRALIESKDFIKQHLHRHHHDPNLKDKKHSLIHQITGKDSPLTFALTSIDNFEKPSTCVQLDCSNLFGYIPLTIFDTVSYNGIVCLNILNCNFEHSICLWNPATKQSRILPQSIALNRLPALKKFVTMVGFGFDVKSNDYKVVNLIKSVYSDENRAEVYSLNTGSWRSVTTLFPFGTFIGIPRMPFYNGTCFFWYSPKNTGILCFDFCSEMFRSISFPCADYFPSFHHIKLVSVIHDKIACAFRTRTSDRQIEIWVFNEYGTVNESWTKLYMIDTYLLINSKMRIKGVSMNGNYIFFKRIGQMCRFNVVTKETNCITLENMPCCFGRNMVEFKESLVSILDA